MVREKSQEYHAALHAIAARVAPVQHSQTVASGATGRARQHGFDHLLRLKWCVQRLYFVNTLLFIQNAAIRPGEFLQETLDDLGLTQAAFAAAIGVSPMRVSHLLKGDRPVTAELALRLGRALGQTPQYWLNLQTTYDLKLAQTEMKDSLLAVRKLAVA